jgi:ATP-dependent helicase/DNAse subunit B
VTYLYNPIDFYLEKVLSAKETTEIEEELSQRNYGTLVHYALEYLYGKIIGKKLNDSDLEDLLQQIDEAIKLCYRKAKTSTRILRKRNEFCAQTNCKKGSRVYFEI